MLNFRFEQGSVEASDTKRDTCTGKVREEAATVDLITELDECVELVLELRL